VTEDDVLAFAAASIRSVWTLELLFTLKRDPARVWNVDGLIRELRSSQVVVRAALESLAGAGLISEENPGGYRYRTASPELDQLVAELEKIYAVKPASVIRAIVSGPNDKLRIFSDAFRFKD
jgi:hypothetical protein